MHTVIHFGIFAAAFSASAFSAENKEPVIPTTGELFRAFETVVFGSEFGDKTARSKVWKWDQPLRISVQAYAEKIIDHDIGVREVVFEKVPVDQQQFGFVSKHLQALAQITGLQTEDYKHSGQEPNVTINFVPKFQMGNPVLAPINPKILKRRAAEQGCYFILWNNPETASIDRAIIVVNAERSIEQIDHCVLEELTQILGFPNDTNTAWASIFSNHHKLTELSYYDRVIIGTLYDPTIAPGMEKKEVMRRARKIIPNYEPGIDDDK